MIEAKLMREDGVLVLTPSGTPSATDFERIGLLIEPYLERNGVLNGVMIYANAYPSWSDFWSLLSQLRFIEAHRHRIKRVAAVTDSSALAILPHIGNYFADADIRHFPYEDHLAAMGWLKHGDTTGNAGAARR